MKPEACPPKTRNWTPTQAGLFLGSLLILLVWLAQKLLVGFGQALPLVFLLGGTGIGGNIVKKQGKEFFTGILEIAVWVVAGMAISGLYRYGLAYWFVGWLYLVAASARGHSTRVREWAKNHA